MTHLSFWPGRHEAPPKPVDLIDDAEGCGAMTAAAHLRAAEPEVFTTLTHPGAGRLVFGDKKRPELGTGVLGRVMREMNRRTDVGLRWSVEGVGAILMVRLGRKFMQPVAVISIEHVGQQLGTSSAPLARKTQPPGKRQRREPDLLTQRPRPRSTATCISDPSTRRGRGLRPAGRTRTAPRRSSRHGL